MIDDVLATIGRFSSASMLVIGDVILDSYLEGRSTRLCREAPAPIVDVERRVDAPGGAANAAASVRALGAHTVLLSVFGADEAGDRLAAALEDFEVDTSSLRLGSRSTLTKQRIVVPPQVLARLDSGTTTPLDAVTESEIVRRLERSFPAVDAVLVSDYGYGLLTDRIVRTLGALQARYPRTLVVDARDLRRFREVGATAVKPNFEEATDLLAAPPGNETRLEVLLGHGEELLTRSGARLAAVTMDVDGAVLIDGTGDWYRTYARPAPNSRAAGAGDTFAAALTLALAVGASPPVAMELASAAAQVVVTRDGTTVCTADELLDALHGPSKLVGGEALPALIAAHRLAGRRLVFTNGCFDIVHRGHVTYLSQAKAQGDVLIVGLNSDASTRRLKGAGRPVNTFEDRARVLEALSCVDHVVGFDDDTPVALIAAIAPDILVKGGDYSRETLPEAELVEALGGEVRFMPYLSGTSTTRLIERIRARATPAAS